MQVPRGSKADKGVHTVPPTDPERLLTDLLRGVSRAFYLTLRVLPAGLREPVGLAYLLARAADAIADTRIFPPGDRLKHLLAFRAYVEGRDPVRSFEGLGAILTNGRALPEERALLASLPQAFSVLEALPDSDSILVRSVVVTLTRGMEIDLTTFPPEDSGQIGAMSSYGELDRYIYYVAGCVGEFWTAITMARSAALHTWDRERMSQIGVRFGKALQLTNVLRDVPRDLRIGRCYLPGDELAEAGLAPEELLDLSSGARARVILVAGIEAALEHYLAAEEYLLAIPRRCLRLRLAVLWPILIGLATLAKLARNESWLDPTHATKVTRPWIYRMLGLSLPCAYSNRLLRGWIARLRKQVQQAL